VLIKNAEKFNKLLNSTELHLYANQGKFITLCFQKKTNSF
jgi:hypothetical protein